MSQENYNLGLEPGKRYRFNFGGSFANVGTYIGRASFSNEWIAMRVLPRDEQKEVLKFYNLRLLCALEPISE